MGVRTRGLLLGKAARDAVGKTVQTVERGVVRPVADAIEDAAEWAHDNWPVILAVGSSIDVSRRRADGSPSREDAIELGPVEQIEPCRRCAGEHPPRPFCHEPDDPDMLRRFGVYAEDWDDFTPGRAAW